MTRTGRLLVTGGGGFVGGHVLSAVAQGEIEKETDTRWTPYAGVLNDAEAASLQTRGVPCARILQADMTDRAAVFEMVEKARPDAVLHLAAQASVARSFAEPEETYRVNVDGTRYLLEALRTYAPQARILLIGSVDQYGDVPKARQPIKETEPLTGKSPYGESKRQQEALALSCVRDCGQDVVLARSAPHIGPGQSRRFAVADWAAQICAMREGLAPHVLRVGNLAAVRDIADVRDVVRAYLLLLARGVRGEVYNVGTGTGTCMADIPPMLAALAGIDDLRIEVEADRLRPLDIARLVPDVSKLRACTGFAPRYTLADTLRAMLYTDGDLWYNKSLRNNKNFSNQKGNER